MLPINSIIYIQIENQIHDIYRRLLVYVWLKKPNNINDENEIIINMMNAILLIEEYGKKINNKS